MVSLAAYATPLEDKKSEWAFELSAADIDDVGDFTEADVTWSWIFAGGRHELGVTVSFFDEDFDDPFIADEDGNTFGPIYQWNWTPNKEWGTGFAFVSFSTVGGDAGDVFDTETDIGAGIKAFVGDSAAISIATVFSQLQGKTGFQDVDATGLVVGISIFTHGR
jgi:hypothetical protein